MLIPLRHVLTIATLLLASGAAIAADGIGAISTDGPGMLVMCRSWLLFRSCRDYNNVTLPGRIAVGDRLSLEFGSNPKDYAFLVGHIARAGNACTVTTDTGGDPNKGNKIEVASCRVAGDPH